MVFFQSLFSPKLSVKCHVAAVKSLSILHYCAVYISRSYRIIVPSLVNSKTESDIRRHQQPRCLEEPSLMFYFGLVFSC